MDKNMYIRIEKYMLSCMNDGAHDCQHIYRVLYQALDIANDYNVDKDVLITACLLHDIGREAQFHDSKLDHAIVGADMAYEFLRSIDWPENKAQHVKACISSHRYRNSDPPISIEAKILFDSDKLDATGTLGIARTLAYKGIVAEPLYYVNEDGNVLDGVKDQQSSFFQEYNWKLKNVYDKFYTDRAKEIAKGRRRASIDFYENMYCEVNSIHKTGLQLLNQELE
jgi:uncharacterized domain HDIG